MTDYKTIAESKNFIVLDKFTPDYQVNESYQSEDDLERDFIRDLQNQGFEYVADLKTPDKMLSNVRQQLQTLNNVVFSDGEWKRFVETYLDKPGDNIIDKTRKIHDDHIHDFVFDDGHIKNIYLLDKRNIHRNACQVIRQFEQTGTHKNRYDVTILVNGLPLVQGKRQINQRTGRHPRGFLFFICLNDPGKKLLQFLNSVSIRQFF